VVSEGYLRAMGVPLRAGRDFTAADAGAGRPVVLVNEALARALWTGQNPLGRVLTAHNVEWEVVGVVAGTRHQALETAAGPEVYFPMRQLNDYGAVHVVVRGPQPPAALAASVGTALRPMDPALPLTEVRVLEALVDQSVAPRRLVAWLLGGFAGFALALATLGLYAVIAYGVAQRTRELGIRLALGATPGDVQGRVLADTLRLAAAGLGVGLLAAWPLARLMRGLLFGIGAADPATLAAALLVLAAARRWPATCPRGGPRASAPSPRCAPSSATSRRLRRSRAARRPRARRRRPQRRSGRDLSLPLSPTPRAPFPAPLPDRTIGDDRAEEGAPSGRASRHAARVAHHDAARVGARVAGRAGRGRRAARRRPAAAGVGAHGRADARADAARHRRGGAAGHRALRTGEPARYRGRRAPPSPGRRPLRRVRSAGARGPGHRGPVDVSKGARAWLRRAAW
jgi:hypothetical protein